MDSEKASAKQVAQAALASLNKSVRLTPTSSTKSRPQTIEDGQNSKASEKLMGKLWMLMTEMYGHKWTSVHGVSDESGTWSKVMAGLSGQQVAAGMQALARGDDPWPPSAPEFRALCEAGRSSLGIPEVSAAWREAVEASTDPANFCFSHPIVQEAARLTDWYSIRHGIPKAETVQNRFNKRYADLTSKLQRGEQLVSDQMLLTQEKAAGQFEHAVKASEDLAKQIAKDQGLTKQSPEDLRKALLEKMGIKR